MAAMEGKVAIVTGGSRGIGRAIADALVTAGANVVIAGRNSDDAQRAAHELNESSGRADAALAVQCDVRSYRDCRRLVALGVEAFGRLDVLVNNAGIGAFSPVEQMEPDMWEAVIETNLNGVFYCSHEAIPHLRTTGGGWIINIGSLAGKNAFPNGAAYNASKFGLIGFSEALMQEVRYDDIRVSYIMPGSVATEFNGRSPGPDADWRIAPEDVARVVLDLLAFPQRSLPSRVELRPSKPPTR
jgi:NAD(P)-dependent dehydrogenase (short-subunit alcohol dehydrogenase family)